MGVKLPDEFFDAMANRPRTEFDEWSERFNAALASAPTVDDATNYAALPLEGRDAFTGSRVTFYENAVLTIDGVSSTVTDVSVSFSDDATEQCAPLGLSPITSTTRCEWIPAFQAWHDRIMLGPTPIGYDEFTRHRDRPLWLRRGQRRAKAKTKRAKMRAARYAARWEQAHLRGEK